MDVITAVHQEVSRRKMLDHPFYQRWNDGKLTLQELRSYAIEYYHFTLAFPTFVSGIHANMDNLETRQSLLENLVEEERGEENHPELWLRFCDALGLSRDEVRASSPGGETRDLITAMRSLTNSSSTHCGLASLYAYEVQIPEVSLTKIEGLRRYFGMTDSRSIQFFTAHAEADVVHSAVAEKLLRNECRNDRQVTEAADAAARTVNALYEFLDGVNR